MCEFMYVPGFDCVMRALLLSNMDGWKKACPFSQTQDVQKAVLSMRGHYCCKSVAVNPLSGRYGASVL